MKKLLLIVAIVFASMTIVSQQVEAKGDSGVFVAPQLHYNIENSESPDKSKSERTDMNLGFRGGYLFNMGLVLGVGYDGYSASLTNTTAGGVSTETARTYSGLGPHIGFWYNGLVLGLNYYMSVSDYELKVGASSTKYQDGSGMSFDLGYMFMLGSKVSVGPVFTSSSMEWKNDENGLALAPGKHTESNTNMYLRLNVLF